MPLSIPQPPDPVSVEAQNGMQRVMRRRNVSAYAGAARETGFDLRAPHKVYTLGLNDLVKGADLENARFAGWRYLAGPTAQVESAPVGVAEVLSLGAQPKFASFNQGWLGAATDLALAKAESLPQAINGKFELRMFRVPAAKIDALWLKSEQRDPDLIVPIASANKLINVDTVYDAADFLPLARQVAQKELDDEEQLGAKGVAL